MPLNLTLEDRLRLLVLALGVAEKREAREREEAARARVRELREQFGREYRAMAVEVRLRYGREPEQTEEAYAERRFAEIVRWNSPAAE